VKFTKSIKIEETNHQALKLFCVKHGLRLDATANEAIKQFLERDQPPGDQGHLFDIPKL
jgi:hypothetical protein